LLERDLVGRRNGGRCVCLFGLYLRSVCLTVFPKISIAQFCNRSRQCHSRANRFGSRCRNHGKNVTTRMAFTNHLKNVCPPPILWERRGTLLKLATVALYDHLPQTSTDAHSPAPQNSDASLHVYLKKSKNAKERNGTIHSILYT